MAGYTYVYPSVKEWQSKIDIMKNVQACFCNYGGFSHLKDCNMVIKHLLLNWKLSVVLYW